MQRAWLWLVFAEHYHYVSIINDCVSTRFARLSDVAAPTYSPIQLHEIITLLSHSIQFQPPSPILWKLHLEFECERVWSRRRREGHGGGIVRKRPQSRVYTLYERSTPYYAKTKPPFHATNQPENSFMIPELTVIQTISYAHLVQIAPAVSL